MYEALINERDSWFGLLTGETEPRVDQVRRPDLVVFRPWIDPLVSRLEVRIAPFRGGSELGVFAYVDEETPVSVEERKWVRYRIGTVFGGAIRDWVEPQ
jgi:hypothetical protein